MENLYSLKTTTSHLNGKNIMIIFAADKKLKSPRRIGDLPILINEILVEL